KKPNNPDNWCQHLFFSGRDRQLLGFTHEQIMKQPMLPNQLVDISIILIRCMKMFGMRLRGKLRQAQKMGLQKSPLKR
ncbi:MAG: hypothetical protein KKE17_09740, partial [Proteobacteria bacterium]|nr:hypothetical protein [Pseudomonadota bacterium]MBU1710273.1 hypothetical protein [Pseudomonadota bacterium]